MKTFNPRAFRVLFGLLLFAAGFYIFYKPAPQDVRAMPKATPAVSVPEIQAPMPSAPAVQAIDTSKPLVVNGKGYLLFTPIELSDLGNWMTKNGYFEERETDEYKSYSDATLTDLARNGDLIALEELTNRAVQAGNKKAALFYMNAAAVYGSTTALDKLTIYTAPDVKNDATEEVRRPAVLETLAVTKLMGLRGDRSLEQVSANSFIKSYKRLYDVDIVLSDEEKSFVDSRAKEMYEKLQAIRTEKGLGDFDNSEPSGVKKFFGLH